MLLLDQTSMPWGRARRPDEQAVRRAGFFADFAHFVRWQVDDITVYKSLGLIAQDIAFRAHLVRKAMRLDACQNIPFVAEHRA